MMSSFKSSNLSEQDEVDDLNAEINMMQKRLALLTERRGEINI